MGGPRRRWRSAAALAVGLTVAILAPVPLAAAATDQKAPAASAPSQPLVICRRIVVKGTSGRPRVDVDAFIVIR